MDNEESQRVLLFVQGDCAISFRLSLSLRLRLSLRLSVVAGGGSLGRRAAHNWEMSRQEQAHLGVSSLSTSEGEDEARSVSTREEGSHEKMGLESLTRSRSAL